MEQGSRGKAKIPVDQVKESLVIKKPKGFRFRRGRSILVEKREKGSKGSKLVGFDHTLGEKEHSIWAVGWGKNWIPLDGRQRGGSV